MSEGSESSTALGLDYCLTTLCFPAGCCVTHWVSCQEVSTCSDPELHTERLLLSHSLMLHNPTRHTHTHWPAIADIFAASVPLTLFTLAYYKHQYRNTHLAPPLCILLELHRAALLFLTLGICVRRCEELQPPPSSCSCCSRMKRTNEGKMHGVPFFASS